MSSATRRQLGRALSRAANATVAEALEFAAMPAAPRTTWRIGITGAPGAGKSSLIGRLAERRLSALEADAGPDGPAETLAVLAIDPSSPVSHGSILGDRIRMHAVSCDQRAYVRSLPSRGGRDGLTHNILDVLSVVEGHGFREVILETVGVGQAEHAVRLLVDSLVLVLHPEAGDSIQAMKAGILELADIYVVNKADLPGARRAVAELRATLRHGTAGHDAWQPPILAISRDDPAGVEALNEALERHRAYQERHADRDALLAARRSYHVQSLVLRRMEEQWSMASLDPRATVRDAYREVIARLATDSIGSE